MQVRETAPSLGMADRVRRSRGRLARTGVASARVTKDEQRELETAAQQDGKALSEWARDVLLERARRGHGEVAVFTELIALRLLLNGVLRELAVGRTMTEQQYQALVIEVRSSKHDTARDVLTQYQPSTAGGQ